MKRLVRKAILWLTLLGAWAALCAAPSWAMTAFAVLAALVSLPLAALACGWRPSAQIDSATRN